MKYALNLGRIFGIRIKIHWTFLLLLAWIAFSGWNSGGNVTEILWNIGFVLAIFTCVILHELGHSLTARRYGIPTQKITLLPIGGVASLDRLPEDPKQELAVAAAGPAVNVVIAAIIFAIFPVTQFFNSLNEAQQIANITADNFIYMLFTANVILVAFNAIPAFPMDGGRVFRALLAFRYNRLKATKIASSTGQILAVGFFILGLAYNPILLLIGVFVFLGARSETMMVKNMSLLEGYKVQDAMMTNFTTLSPNNTLDDAIEAMIAGPDADLIIEEDGKIQGIVSRDELSAVIREGTDRNTPVSKIMDSQVKTLEDSNMLTDAYQQMQKKRYHSIPVIKENQLAGIINMEKIQEFLLLKARRLQY